MFFFRSTPGSPTADHGRPTDDAATATAGPAPVCHSTALRRPAVRHLSTVCLRQPAGPAGAATGPVCAARRGARPAAGPADHPLRDAAEAGTAADDLFGAGQLGQPGQ